MEKEEVKYKDLSKNDIKILIENINKNLKELNENISKLFSILLKTEEEKKKIPEGYKSFTFINPIPKNSGLEGFLLNRILNRESQKHKIEFFLNKNRNEEILQVFVKGEETHIKHIFEACSWINRKLKENKEKETKTIPKEMI
jgi:hypothetical protein